MRALPPSIAQALAEGAAMLCRCWRLSRRDGLVLGFTDHDRDLTIGGQVFEASDGFELSAIEREAGLATQGGEVRGLLSSERIRAQEIEAGLFDGARLEVFLVDWSAPALDFLLDAATLGEIRRHDNRFVAETRDAFAAYDVVQGRLYSAACSARFGDAACGIDTAAPTLTIIASITGLNTARVCHVALAGNKPTGFFALGQAVFTTGPNAGFRARIEAHDGALITLASAPPAPLALGDGLTLTAGCDKRFVTCRDRFANAPNFRGFPFIPAPESVLTYARPGEGRHKGRPLVR